MNTSTQSGYLTDGVRDPKNQNRNIQRGVLLPRELAKNLYDKQRINRQFGSFGLPPKIVPFHQPTELSGFSQYGSGISRKKNISNNKMKVSQYAGAHRAPRKRVGAKRRVRRAPKMLGAGFFGNLFSGIKRGFEQVLPIVKAIKPISNLGSMIGLPSPLVELGKQIGVGRRRKRVGARRRVGARKRAPKRRVGGAYMSPAVIRNVMAGMGLVRPKRKVGGAKKRRPTLLRLF